LNETGRAQAQGLPQRLAKYRVDAIYSSPLERALETAGPVAANFGLQVQESAALLEFDFGDWSGMTLTALEECYEWRMFNQFRSSTRAPKGELMTEVQVRMITEMGRLRGGHENQTVLLFSHADSIKAALIHYLGMPLDHKSRLEISPASISEVRLADWGVEIWGVNLTA